MNGADQRSGGGKPAVGGRSDRQSAPAPPDRLRERCDVPAAGVSGRKTAIAAPSPGAPVAERRAPRRLQRPRRRAGGPRTPVPVRTRRAAPAAPASSSPIPLGAGTSAPRCPRGHPRRSRHDLLFGRACEDRPRVRSAVSLSRKAACVPRGGGRYGVPCGEAWLAVRRCGARGRSGTPRNGFSYITADAADHLGLPRDRTVSATRHPRGRASGPGWRTRRECCRIRPWPCHRPRCRWPGPGGAGRRG